MYISSAFGLKSKATLYTIIVGNVYLQVCIILDLSHVILLFACSICNFCQCNFLLINLRLLLHSEISYYYYVVFSLLNLFFT